MESSRKNIITQKTARYYIAGSAPAQTKNMWVVIHGYGQLAEKFIRQFDFLANEDTLIIAPEGLSRFYTGSATGNAIGAAWMTKEDRDNEIKDYIAYLDAVLSEVLNTVNNPDVRINVLGFSQGVHTVARWFILSNNRFESVYLCSDDFPVDADFEKLKSRLENSKMFYIYGNADGIIPQTSFERSVKMLKEKDINFTEIIFDGKHSIHDETIKKLAGK